MDIRPVSSEIKDFVDIYYCPDSENYPTDQLFPVPTFIRSWVIFCIKGNARILINEKEFVPPITSVKGAFDHPYLFGYTQKHTVAVLVQFSAVGLYELTQKDVSKFKNKYVDAYELFDNESLDQVNTLLKDTTTIDERTIILDAFFVKAIEKRKSQVFNEKSRLVLSAINLARENGYNISLNAICDELAVSIKTLERVFKTVTGLTPKKYFSGCLLEEISRILMTEKHKRISEIMSSPFYDFSHINKWFSKYTNIPPSSFNQQEYHLLEEIMKYQNQFDAKSQINDPVNKLTRRL